MDEYLTGAQFAHKALLDGHLIARKNQRITELKDEAARKNQRITELKDEALQQTLTARRVLRRAEKAEAHAADCKRLVTACENDLDAERMKRREAEAELKSAKHLNAKWMDERTTALMDKEKAEAALATRTANRDELIEMVRSLKAALVAANKGIDAMEDFIDHADYCMRAGRIVSYTGPRAEKAKP